MYFKPRTTVPIRGCWLSWGRRTRITLWSPPIRGTATRTPDCLSCRVSRPFARQPTRRDILFENVYGPMRDRFNATTLAREVKSHVEEVIHDLKDPNPFGSFGLPSLPSDTLNLHPSNPGKPAQPTSSKRIGYDQVLITGERGNLEFIDGRFIGSNDPENASFLSI